MTIKIFAAIDDVKRLIALAPSDARTVADQAIIARLEESIRLAERA